eukprot:8946200-Pyramimonas_sp.AAC.1
MCIRDSAYPVRLGLVEPFQEESKTYWTLRFAGPTSPPSAPTNLNPCPPASSSSSAISAI